MADTRKIAFDILFKIENDGAYSNITINNAVKENKLNTLDASFVSALVYGVLETKLTLDYILKQFSNMTLRKIELKTKIILRLGIYQLVFMDKVPDSAAVNESVNLTKKLGLLKSTPFVNGVLRNIARAENRSPLPNGNDTIYNLSIRYSCPDKLVRLWNKAYGRKNAERIMLALSGRPTLYARVNTLKTNTGELLKIFEQENIGAEKSEILENVIKIKNTGSIEKLCSYKNGLFHIQDLSSQLCVSVLNAKENEIVIDVCSAPGGKSFTIAENMNSKGKVFSCDMYEHKLKLIENGAKRLGISNITTLLRDGTDENFELEMADKILCDVPCSGLGVLAKKPEIRYKEDLIDNNLPDIQYKILCESSKYLKIGGIIVYSTCTLNPAENSKNTAKFLEEHKNFEGIKLELPQNIRKNVREKDYELTVLPDTADSDGFYISAFTRRS